MKTTMVKYPIPQSLHVLVDFSSRCDGKLGLGNLREVYLLVDENSTAQSRQYCLWWWLTSLARNGSETSRDRWWDDLWLNEKLRQYDGICQLGCPSNQAGISSELPNNWCACCETRCYRWRSIRHVEVKHPDEISTLTLTQPSFTLR